MKLTAAEVIATSRKDMEALVFDPDLLQRVIDSFDYIPTMDSILYRYCDVANGRTKLIGDDVVITEDSAVTELPLSPALYQTVTKAGIVTIKDISLERCRNVLSFEDYVELTAGMVTLGV